MNTASSSIRPREEIAENFMACLQSRGLNPAIGKIQIEVIRLEWIEIFKTILNIKSLLFCLHTFGFHSRPLVKNQIISLSSVGPRAPDPDPARILLNQDPGWFSGIYILFIIQLSLAVKAQITGQHFLGINVLKKYTCSVEGFNWTGLPTVAVRISYNQVFGSAPGMRIRIRSDPLILARRIRILPVITVYYGNFSRFFGNNGVIKLFSS